MLPSLSYVRDITRTTACQKNHGNLVSAWIACSLDNSREMPSSDTTVGAWVHAGNTIDAIKKGKLFPYVDDIDTYRCPSDPSGHYRSYSANGFLNGSGSWPFHPWIKPFHYTNSIVHHGGQLVFIEENDPRGSNLGSWVIHPAGHPQDHKWIDYVGVFHKTGDNISFLDGHVEFFEYQDERTLNFANGGFHFFESQPNNPDLIKYQSMYNTN